MNFSSIVSAEQTFQHLNDPDWLVFDCRFDLNNEHLGLEKYKSGHIPNAIYADLNKDLSSPVSEKTGRHPLPDVQTISEKFGSWGIKPDTQVVVYDDVYGSYAGRLWWILRWLGHKNVAVLNGGLTQWERLHYPLSKEIPKLQPTTFSAKPDETMIADISIVEQSVSTPNITLIDVRDSDRYKGQREPIDKIAGHVPGSINIPWKSNLDKNGLYLEKSELVTHYADLIHKKDLKDVIFMCGSGVTACHSLVALEYLDFQGATLYPGSWSEWIQDPKHPVDSTIQK
ncbi:sulfurtransferase [Kaarinaea lacus]